MSGDNKSALDVERVEVQNDERLGVGGFLVLRRLTLVNRRADGSASEPYSCDFVERSYGLDAVAVVVYRRTVEPGRLEVLLRRGLRPPMEFGRGENVPIADENPSPFCVEIAAGLIENHDRGVAGIEARASAEIEEELGYKVAPERLVSLGAPVVPTPSVIPERLYLYAAELTSDDVRYELSGDGSPMEEGAETSWWALGEAIRACTDGRIVDAKTEIGLRRLQAKIAG